MSQWQRIANTEQMKSHYDAVVVGSGYGGSITAVRLAELGMNVCMLERGKEWVPGEMPDTPSGFVENLRHVDHRCGLFSKPLGLYEYLAHDDIDVLQGCGLGGTSLINANVAIRPDRELFAESRWPKALQQEADSGKIWDWYAEAEKGLGANPHPNALELKKVQALKKGGAGHSDAEFSALNIVVNFNGERTNSLGEIQAECTDCGDCITGCNVGAKNTLRMNYLPQARAHGAAIFTRIEVSHIQANADGGFSVWYRRNSEHGQGELESLSARKVVLSAGSLGSTGILLRSARNGLPLSRRLGDHFGGNGDFFGIAYNNDEITNVMGFGNHPESERSVVQPGPSIVGVVQYHRKAEFRQRITIEDLGVPSGLVDIVRKTLPKLSLLTGSDTDPGLSDKVRELRRMGMDLMGWNATGALNSSMVYLAMGVDGSQGRLSLTDSDHIDIQWEGIADRPIFETINKEIRAHAEALGGTFIENPRWSFLGGRNLITAHPLGGCSLADDPDHGVVDDQGRVFDGEGGVHEGLYVIDGAIIPMALGVNPLLTISALAARTSAQIHKD